MSDLRTNPSSFTPPTIIDYDYYVAHYALPTTQNKEEQKRQVELAIVQVQDQIDALCDGRVYEEYPYLNPTESDEDNKRIYYLEKSCGDLLEYYINTAKLFCNKQFQSTGNIPFSISSSSNDANFELTRQDIIKKLVKGGWYSTLMTFDVKSKVKCRQSDELTWNELITRLAEVFKTLDNTNQFTSDISTSGNQVKSVSKLTPHQQNISQIEFFNLANCLWNGVELHNYFYPIGTIYTSKDINFDPNTAFGGTWTKIDEGNLKETIIYMWERTE